jgi:dTDP-4-dehydrorhamnose reductase
MKIVILGSNGMLGTYLSTYFKNKFDLLLITRADYDLSKINEREFIDFITGKIDNDDIIINAAGVIKQRDYNPIESIMVNSILPHILENVQNKCNCKVIHITTDCVFSGLKGKYTEDDKHDCVDEYGKSKSLGENTNIMNIRTSIIGEEKFNKKSLISWVISNSGKEIDGYTNHLWNGVTCLELCILIENIIKEKLYWKGIRHIFSPNTVSKSQLISIINEVYELGITINDKETEVKCFRNLDTIKDDGMIYKDIRSQIIDLKKFKL